MSQPAPKQIYNRKLKMYYREPHERKRVNILQERYLDPRIEDDMAEIKKYFEDGAYEEAEYEDQVVLDIGAGAGFHAAYAIKQGARYVMTIEPDIENNILLQKNWRDKNKMMSWTPIAVGNKSDFTYGTEVGENEEKIKVKIATLDFYFNPMPQIIRVNAGGGEYLIFHEWPVSGNIHQIVLDLHMSVNGISYRRDAMRLHRRLKKSGFESNKEPDYSKRVDILIYKR
jgi:FkbM family methyltransferase